MKKISIAFISLLLLTSVTGVAHLVHAQANGQTNGVDTGTPSVDTGTPSLDTATPSTGLVNPLHVDSIAGLVDVIMGYVVIIGSIFLTLMLIYTGFKFIMARGNEEKVGEARSALLWTIVGGLLLLGAKVIASAIAATVAAL